MARGLPIIHTPIHTLLLPSEKAQGHVSSLYGASAQRTLRPLVLC
jgi:hypothetical protein